jgi:hypothetical protein
VSERRLSPTAASAQARRAAKNRFKLLRLGKRADSASVFAGRIAGMLAAASGDAPDEYSPAYAEWVVSQYRTRCAELQKAGRP